jgi:pyruvate formate lyase activating enzyme
MRRCPPMAAAAVPAHVTGRHWRRLADGHVECALCPRLCNLAEGERGACEVWVCRDSDLVLDLPPYLDALRVEPIEAHSLMHFLPGTLVLSVGRAGTNLHSRLQLNGCSHDGPSAGSLPEANIPEWIARDARAFGCASVALGGTDPAIAVEQAARVAEVCRAAGLKTITLTRGYMCPAPRAELFRHDAARVELFAFKERFYYKHCNGHIAPVLDTIMYLAKHTSIWLEVAVPLIPGENDTVGEIERLSRWVTRELRPEVPLHFKISHLIATRSASELRQAEISAARAQRIACMNGVRYVYTDDLFDHHGRTTACHRCGTALINREWYQVSDWRLTGSNACPHCGAPCPGVFAGRPPAWGEWPRTN